MKAYSPIQRIQQKDDASMRSQEQMRATVNAVAADLGKMVPPPVPQWTILSVASSGTPIGQLINGWLPFDSVRTPRLWRDGATRRVQLTGRVKSGTIGTVLADALLLLPAGYRPAQPLTFAVASNDLFGEVIIGANSATSGCYDVLATVGSNAWVSLDGISFLAEQ